MAWQSQRPHHRSSRGYPVSTMDQIMGQIGDEQNVLIVVMGATGSGKTSFINMASGSNLRTSASLASCTDRVQPSESFTIDGRLVTLIDTPGFDDSERSDTDVLKMIALFLQVTYEAGKKLAGVIYVHRILDPKLGGVSRRNFRMFRQLCGDETLKNVVIVTSMWDRTDYGTAVSRERELSSSDDCFKVALDHGAKFTRHQNNMSSAQSIIRLLLPNAPQALAIQRELVDERKAISQTGAGVELNQELLKQAQKHREEMEALRQEMSTAMRADRQQIAAEYQKVAAELKRVQGESEKLADGFNQEKARVEQMMQVQDQAVRDANRSQLTRNLLTVCSIIVTAVIGVESNGGF
ncbi:hypothetical protein JAAARDRAFT_59361 [Jaapia argillacea MUCL 33604]|uniref:AIG1-type G domain-containing protein n=1 Tax=Jaapia argillacea MUCL 33604 TaxID=933084 RepID=A0A067PM26_9AGAM|nr:hypothetical protein JAAARDRAFT_59361 [Jaapia argillacea MUCL 33604]